MKFGPVPLAEAEGALLAHSVKVGKRKLKKGQRLGPDEVQALHDEGLDEIIVARLDPGDLDENAAARRLAEALVPDPAAAHLKITEPFTGRVNLIAEGPGVLEVSADAIHAANRVHPMITVATLEPWQQMAAGQMAATIKIISYAVPGADVETVAEAARASLKLRVPVMKTAGLIVTDIPGGPKNDKGIRAVEARVEALGMDLTDTRIVRHRTDEISGALEALDVDLALILTGSATSDPQDVAPEAVRQAGGTVERFGMPVDPGNLLFLGDLKGRPVIGLPGCARSPALNGADWVLSRVACGVAVTGADIAAMGVGGLLKEIPTRPQPRSGRTPE